MPRDDTVAALTQLVKRLIRSERGSFSTFVQATFVAAETSDADLSQISVNGVTVRNVPKHSHVGTMTAGQQLTCIQGGGIPLTILGIRKGAIYNS